MKATQNKSTRPSPPTQPSVGEKLETETGNPLRPEARSYRGAEPGYSLDQVNGVSVFRTQHAFTNDSDDPEEIAAELTQAGVDEPRMEPDGARDDIRAEDREFEENEEAMEFREEGGLSDEDNDLEKIPDRKAFRVDKKL